ncbi:MAG: hypothetical protein RLZZ325_1135, partial [Pseudomonadota bacterium]
MQTIQNKKGLKFFIAAVTLWAGAALAQSGNYPNKPIKFIVPYPPGGGTDVIARIAQTRIAESLGQQVIIENRGGAGGSIGTDVVAKSAADGYTVLFTLSSHTINAAIYPKLPFNTERDFIAISQVASLPQILVAHPDYPVRNAQDVVKLARSRPGTVLYASVGNVSSWDSTVEAFAKVRSEHGNPDILVNNAGITRDGVFTKMTRAQWDEVIDTNLNSLFNVTKQVVEGMAAKGWGRIVNISSVNGQKGQFGQTNYSTAKAGIHGFT